MSTPHVCSVVRSRRIARMVKLEELTDFLKREPQNAKIITRRLAFARSNRTATVGSTVAWWCAAGDHWQVGYTRCNLRNSAALLAFISGPLMAS